MENVKPSDAILVDLKVSEVVSHLELMGWKKVDSNYEDLLVYEGPLDDDDKPIRLTLTNGDRFEDAKWRMATAINTLSAVEKTSPEALIVQLRAQDLDILRIRVSHPLIGRGAVAMDHAINWLD